MYCQLRRLEIHDEILQFRLWVVTLDSTVNNKMFFFQNYKFAHLWFWHWIDDMWCVRCTFIELYIIYGSLNWKKNSIKWVVLLITKGKAHGIFAYNGLTFLFFSSQHIPKINFRLFLRKQSFFLVSPWIRLITHWNFSLWIICSTFTFKFCHFNVV